MNTMDFQSIQKRLSLGLPVLAYDRDEIKYIGYPIGQQLYKRAIEENREIKPKKMPYDNIECTVCGEIVKRHYQSHHKKTRLCQVYAKMNVKLRDLLIDK
jgi:formylmethanofuran dehydrogenase subunit E